MDDVPNETPHLVEDLGWNNSAEWVDYIEYLSPTIVAIATKYTDDEALQEDAVQNAKIVLLHKFPEEVRGYEDYVRGETSIEQWQKTLRAYCLTACRNEILSTLSSHTTGNLYVGRSRTRRVMRGEKVVKVKTHLPARFVSLDQLIEEAGLQVSESGELSWDSFNEVDYGDEDA